MIQAIDCQSGELAQSACRAAFDRGLVIETSGARDQVIKFIPPLTIPDDELDRGLDILRESLLSIRQSQLEARKLRTEST